MLKTDTRWTARPSPLHYWRRWGVAAALLALGAVLRARGVEPAGAWLLAGGAGVVAWTAVVWWFGGQAWVSDRRIAHSRGVVSRHTSELRIERVADVEVRQNAVERWLGIGRVRISGDEESGTGPIQLSGVREPHDVAQLIREQREDVEEDK